MRMRPHHRRCCRCRWASGNVSREALRRDGVVGVEIGVEVGVEIGVNGISLTLTSPVRISRKGDRHVWEETDVAEVVVGVEKKV